MTGNIPVIPYPDADLSRSLARIEWSYPTEASLEVTLKPKSGSIDTPQVFHLGLKRTGARSPWVVDSWTADVPIRPPDSC
jgi:hypothetical protein